MLDRQHLRSLLLVACLAWQVPALACSGGEVFIDRNGDGLRQRDEDGAPGIQVSNGREIVSTDSDGHWRGLPARDGGLAFVIKPAGFAIAKGRDGLPAFWQRGDQAQGAEACRIALRAVAPAPAPLKLIVSSDPQAGTPREVDHYRAIVADSLAAHRDARLGLTLGDIANDDLALYPPLVRATASLGLPWLHVAGNHDLDADAGDDPASLTTYRRVFGPDTYAWEEREAVFVMLDNVVASPGRKPAYVGGLREDQFVFLENYLATLDHDRPLLVAAHIPWFDTAGEGRPATVRPADRARLFALLRPFRKPLLLTGHRHSQRRHFHDAASGWGGDQPLQEYNVGAMSGAYWSGVDDTSGIPLATMADGTPRGFATLVVSEAGDFRMAWHPTVRQADDPAITDAMALHAPRVLRRGAYPAWGVHANVFMGHDATRVEYRIDAGDWKPMAKRIAPDPRLLAENARDDEADALRSFDRSPEAEPSTHLWRGALATDLPEGEHVVEVRAFDDHGGEHRASIRYRLLDGAP